MTTDEFRALLPEFKNADSDMLELIETYLAQSEIEFDEDRWGEFLAIGRACWVAHRVVLTPSNGPVTTNIAGDIVSKSVGGVSVSRSGELLSKQADNEYYQTRYGQRYLGYARMVGAGGVVV